MDPDAPDPSRDTQDRRGSLEDAALNPALGHRLHDGLDQAEGEERD